MTRSNPNRPHLFYAGLLFLLTLWMGLPGLDSIPVIDRDEARYAQATVQMVEDSDYVEIKFQDRARNKKPAGAYWAQAASVQAISDTSERAIWAHRVPSILAAIMAVLATYWGGTAIMGRPGAAIGAALLATSALFVFEAHIAKTDALLCAMSAIVLGCFMHLRRAPKDSVAIAFWAALGVGIMVKGPVLPALVLMTLIGLFIWEREATWLRSLINWPGLALFAFIVLPWSIMIMIATNGAFFTEAFGNDLAPKLMGGQEKHGAPIGTYLATLPILFWPGSLILLCGLWFGVQAARQKSGDNEHIAAGCRLLLLWIVPFWLLLEIVPTKLPNYLLPAYPAIALLCGGALSAMLRVDTFKISRRIGAVIFFFASIALITTVLSAEALYAPNTSKTYWIGLIAIALTFLTFGSMWSGRIPQTLLSGLVTTMLMTIMTYHTILPRLDRLYVSHRIEAALTASNIALPRQNGPRILSPHFTEPSLVYRLGTNIILGDKTEPYMLGPLDRNTILLLDMENDASRDIVNGLRETACFEEINAVKGFNYSKGDKVDISILRPELCPSPENGSPVNGQ